MPAISTLLQFGMAGAVIFVVIWFISYLEKKDKKIAEAEEKERLERQTKDDTHSALVRDVMTLIGNHLDHSTKSIDKNSEATTSLRIALDKLNGTIENQQKLCNCMNRRSHE